MTPWRFELPKSVAPLLARRGLAPYALQLFMGHGNLDTLTLEYCVDQEKIDAAGEAMKAMFPRPALPQPGGK